MPTTIYLDTETTGLDAFFGDEIVEIAIIDEKGKVLLNTLVQPVRNQNWKEAESIHGISPKMVKDAPTFEALKPRIKEICKGKTVVIYNAAFDTDFMKDCLEESKVKCCMLPFAEFYGDWHSYYENYTWQPLSTAARYVGYTFEGKAHRALADTLACRAVWQYIKDPINIQKRKDEIVEKERKELERKIDTYAERLHWKIKSDREVKEDLSLRDFIDATLVLPYNEIEHTYIYKWSRQDRYNSKYLEALNRDYLSNLYFLFTGETLAFVELKEKYPNTPIYRLKKEIPKELASESKLRKDNASIVIERDFFDIPQALYVSKTQKQILFLFSIKDFKKQHKKAMRVITSMERKEEGLKTMTEIERTKEDFTNYKCVGIQKGQFGDWWYLYERNKILYVKK